MSFEPPTQLQRGQLASEISTRIVQLCARYYGKGPTKAKTNLVDGIVICTLRDGLTTLEKTLLESGETKSVYDVRASFQRAMEEEFTRVVEEVTGRKVIAYMSTSHVDPDLAVEIFLLEPVDETPQAE